MKPSFFACCLISVFILVGCSQKHPNEHHEAAVFAVTKPIVKDTTIFKEYICQIRSIQHIELRALEKGYLQKVMVDEGQLVKSGQLLFQIMPTVYRVDRNKALAELHYAEREFQNTKMLADGRIVSPNELALVEARLEKAKAELAMAETHLKFTEIKAPFEGIVGRFNDVRLGSLVDEGDLLTTLSDNRKMWVYFNVPERQYLNFGFKSKDEPLKVQLLLANNEIFPNEGLVETIEADFNNETGNIAFRATFDNPERLLRHGQTGKVLMPEKLENVLLIPQEATFQILDKTYVFVVDAAGNIESRQITTGVELPHLYSVSDGLRSHEQILTEGLRKVKNGEQIKYRLVAQDELIKELQRLHAE